MIRRLIARIGRIDWLMPWTAPARGGGPMLDRLLDEQRIREDERRRTIRQENTAHGQPPRCIPGKAHP
jgi:hypothetical protein